MADQDQSERVWDIIEQVGVGMLTTRFSGGFRARPLEARADREAGIIWFLTDARSAKDHEIGAEPDVGLVFIDPGKKVYLSITARAQIRRDLPQAQKIWKTTDKMWWDGPEDPNLRVLRVDPQCAELWDGPSSVARNHKQLRGGSHAAHKATNRGNLAFGDLAPDLHSRHRGAALCFRSHCGGGR